MKKENEIYRGVPLTCGRTKEMIDYVIENRNDMNAKDMAKQLGLVSYVPIAHISRYLNKNKPKVVIKEAKNTFSNYYGSGKEKARDLIASAIMDTKRQSSNVLTLPAENWLMEKNIIKKKPGYKFTAVERKKETFDLMLGNAISNSNIKDSVIAYLNKTVGEVIVNDKEDTYSSMILDYCGFIDSFYDEINDIMKRNLIKKGGYITITLSENDRMLNHSQHTTSCSNTYIQNCCANEKVNGAKVTNDLVNILVYNNIGYKIVNKFSYRDNTVNMLLFIINRIEE
jgi:hypothetical protein